MNDIRASTKYSVPFFIGSKFGTNTKHYRVVIYLDLSKECVTKPAVTIVAIHLDLSESDNSGSDLSFPFIEYIYIGTRKSNTPTFTVYST
jgi:hypothetical protein